MKSMEKGYCLVLSGGGTRGVYHIGVWKALKELGIGVDAFVGTSIGAIIAGFLVQGADGDLEELGSSVTIESILAIPGEFLEAGALKIDPSDLAAAPDLLKSIYEHKGLDTGPLRKILVSRLDEERIRKSGKDLGIVAVNLSTLTPREVFIEEMEGGRLVDYLMASAALPGFSPPVIAGKKYVDGGIYDNIPYAMARKRGYRRIIISDISGAGRNRRPEIEGSVTIYIKNSMDIGGLMDFDRTFLKDFAALGYLDTLRTFGKLEGYDYFLEPNPKAESAFASWKRALPAPQESARHGFPSRMAYDGRELLKYLECAGSALDIRRIHAYSYASLAGEIDRARRHEDTRIDEILGSGGEKLAGIVSALHSAVADRNFERCPYYYLRLAEELLPKTAGRMLKKALFRVFPGLSAGMCYVRKYHEFKSFL